jgi:hypothetical protein
MSDRWRSRPQVESLESMTLLSGVAGTLHAQSAMTVVPITPVATHLIHLTGTAKGSYHARSIPDAGKTYTFSGAGQISPLLGQTNVTGTVQLPGLIITPVPTPTAASNTKTSPPIIPPLVLASGELTLSSPPIGAKPGAGGPPAGTLKLKLSGLSHDNANTLPPFFFYTITDATGVYKGDTGSGAVVITVNPVKPTPTANAISGLQEQGSFTMNFLKFLPPTPVPGAVSP